MSVEKDLKRLRGQISTYMNLQSRVEPNAQQRAIAQKMTQLDDMIARASGETARTNLQKSVGVGGKNQRADVRLVQQLLQDNAGYRLTIDGWIGRETISFIHQFQKSMFNGWSDGRIDPNGNTWKQLQAKKGSSQPPVADAPSNPKGNLSAAVGAGVTEGNRKADVLWVQQLLNKVKAGLSEDGQIGNNTIQAIHRYQRSIFNGWSDGRIDPNGNTWKQLKMGKGSAAVSTGGGQAGTGSNRLFRTNGHIASIPQGATGNLPLVVLFGGASYANPEWMLKQTPNSYLSRALVYIVPQRTGYGNAQAAFRAFFASKSIGIGSISICGFSGGGQDVQFASGSFKVKGLMDPYTVPAWVNRNLGSSVIMEYNAYNWGGPYLSTRKALPQLANSVRKNGGTARQVSVSHANFPSYFLKKYASKML